MYYGQMLERLLNMSHDDELVVCKDCEGTGMKDRVRRCFFAPGTCPPCSGTGWVNPKTGKRFEDR